MKEMRVFDSIVFPYAKDDLVDGILKLDIKGGWDLSIPDAFVKSVFLTLSMFTLSPFLGGSTTGTHDVVVTLNKGAVEVARYSVYAKTTIEWGLTANFDEVNDKARTLQERKLAIEIAKQLNNNYSHILKEFDTGAIPQSAALPE